ncbi:FAD/FMN-dependent dehydrogenase [Frankia casuarinae]|uniref:D-lactate dehydrogenase (Cytochrome) n=1 Tax=Frankia casuarinae (strain DSM 45818 / CECT 9043 / HFP020203 / CcI3) TaxID=106370 RepID=Q2JBI5_FRACC|nr:FAD-binding and (Fe-S)-binding domain-containing protein [Frankia casuarinae]ABD11357.1 D-lactate dehydrogenase (cytochrome) [Frankia casuarinae]EYT91931.1 FAD/FMN-dependent dehydrogenase [Frankia casuarinae]
MTAVRLPDPVRRVRAMRSGGVSAAALERDLAARVDGEVRFDAGTRGAYSTDASNFRQLPIGVVVPRSVEAGAEAVAVCREHDAPVLSRGGGTSLAGESTNAAVMIDWSKYCTGLLSVDPDGRRCVVEPGVVLDHLNDLLSPHGLRFGPEPATHNHCTLGGMIGNNSCGSTAQRAGKVVDNIARLEVLLYDGTRMWVGETSDDEYVETVRAGGRRAQVYRQVRELRDHYLAEIRRCYPEVPRRVSGYNLDSLLPEKHFHVARALVGSESTLVTVLRAELELVPVVPAQSLVVLGYPDIAAAGDAVRRVLPHDPIALEGLDDRLIHFEREKHLYPEALALLPEGSAGWLLVQFGGQTTEEADRKARAMLDDLCSSPHPPVASFFDDPAREAELWEVREAGLGATTRVPGLPDTWPGFEDSAVSPDRLGDYLRDLRKLYGEFGFSEASLYGHFGQGCVHSRIPFDLVTASGVGSYREFLERAADLVASYGGSLSGEHGDGQQRGELLPKMFGADIVRAFGQFKAIFDPGNRMNPGKVVAPYPIDDKLRLGADWEPAETETFFRYPHDGGSFSRAVLRCVGVGRCRREGGGVMCPSYMVTREEEHSTRGRARLLFEMLAGHPDSPIRDGWRSTAVRDALDLCLACKGCKSDCPVNVDMATYKAEFLAHHYAGRIRPLAHYSMGWLPLAARLASLAPRTVNALATAPGLTDLVKLAGGVARARAIPPFASESLQAWYARRGPRGSGRRGEVVLWPDTFTNRFHPHIGQAAIEVLEDAGWRVVTPGGTVCCGLTWISTGQLATAQRVLRRTTRLLHPYLRAGTPIVGLEPSCTAVFRSDAEELFPRDPDVSRLRQQTLTFAELLYDRTPGWQPPSLGRPAMVQTHCHQHAVLGFNADTALMREMGMDPRVLDSGCCGLAGNFGFERGHYDVSQACGERVLFPALRDAPDGALVLADGFSCRTQIEQGEAGGRQAVHLAEVVAMARFGDVPAARPEQAVERPSSPRAASLAVLPGLGVAAAAAGGLAARAAGQRIRDH